MSKGRKTHDELAKRVMEALLARLDAPVTTMAPDVSVEHLEIEEDWSLFKELHPELYVGKPDPDRTAHLKAVVSGTKPITIRVPNRVLQAFHRQADKTGVPYQTLMNRVLADAADAME